MQYGKIPGSAPAAPVHDEKIIDAFDPAGEVARHRDLLRKAAKLRRREMDLALDLREVRAEVAAVEAECAALRGRILPLPGTTAAAVLIGGGQ